MGTRGRLSLSWALIPMKATVALLALKRHDRLGLLAFVLCALGCCCMYVLGMLGREFLRRDVFARSSCCRVFRAMPTDAFREVREGSRCCCMHDVPNLMKKNLFHGGERGGYAGHPLSSNERKISQK